MNVELHRTGVAETTLLSLRPTRLIALHYYAVAFFLFILSALTFLDVTQLIPDWRLFGFRIQSYGGAILGFIGLVTLLLAELRRLSLKYTITDSRIIIHSGILSRKMNQMPFNKIERVEMDQSLLQRIFKFGDIVMDTGEDQMVLGSLGHVNLVQDEVSKLVATYSKR